MISKKIKDKLRKQHYYIFNHSAVQVCGWCKNSLRGEGVCYKEKFYGIESHKCCQMSPFILCPNSCLHCWRPMEFGLKNRKIENIDSPEKILKESIKGQRKLLSGFKGYKNVDMEKWEESKNPNQFAISLIGEPTLYPNLGEFIELLKKKGNSSFLVSNGLYPEVFEKLDKKNQLPTQLYLSLNSSNKEDYKKWHNSDLKNAWERFNKSLKLMKNLDTRTVIRLTLVKEKNAKEESLYGFSELIKKASPDFVEVKSYMSVGYSRKRLNYKNMLSSKEVKDFSEKLLKFLPKYKLLDEHKRSRVVLLGKSKKKMKIQKI